ncbi:MAG TPA: hypothetical protein VKY40_03940, partial [Halanaerobiales bacterium]|nr:hypothetical protein [Halanaerobiales bacterium]
NLHQSLSGIVFNRTYYKLILYLLCGLAGYLLLPIRFFLSITLITIFSFIWKMEKIPLLEMIYFSVIIGIVAGRMGLLL